MSKIMAIRMGNKRVVDSDGGEIGLFHNVVAEDATGLLKELVVKPTDELDLSRFKKESGFIFIPFDAVTAVKDVIVVDSEKMRARA